MASSTPPSGNFYRPGGYRPDESVGYLMRRIVTGMAAAIERDLESTGLTNAQWLPLFKLYRGSASTVAELARECQLDAGAMTRLLDRLEAKGLLRRERSSQDRRVVQLSLTDEGRAAARQIPAVLCKVQNQHLAGLSTEEFEQLGALLRRVHDNGQALLAAQEGAE